MSLIATAQTKAVKGNVKEAFKNEAGAIDLASIMVGIIVIGLIGGVIAATVFAVIPWAQNNAAKQQLDSVAAAQSAYIGLAADTAAISFGDATDLKGQGLFDATAAKVKVAVTGSGDAAHYIAVKRSASGAYFYITDYKTQPSQSGTTGNAATAVFTGSAITGPTTINGVTWGSATDPDGAGPLTSTNVSWTGTF